MASQGTCTEIQGRLNPKLKRRGNLMIYTTERDRHAPLAMNKCVKFLFGRKDERHY